MNPVLSIIIINYNTKDLLLNCLTSIRRYVQGIDYEVIVIDNGSSDGSAEAVEKISPRIVLIKNNENTGFARANNQGIKAARGKYFCLLNSDTLLIEDMFFKIIQYAQTHHEAGIVGPRVLNEDHTVQESFGRFHTLKVELYRFLRMEHHIRRFMMNRDVRKWGSVPHKVDWVSGCCFLIRKAVVEQIGYLDETFFLFNEEVDFCKRASDSGWDIIYFPEVSIIHYGSRSARNDYHVMIYCRYISRLHYYNKHYRKTGVFIFRMINVSAILIRILLIRFAWFFEKNERIQRARALRQALISYLANKDQL